MGTIEGHSWKFKADNPGPGTEAGQTESQNRGGLPVYDVSMQVRTDVSIVE